MDRSDTTSDLPADPPTGPVTAPVRSQALGLALRGMPEATDADTTRMRPPPIHRAPPRPLVPRAYRQAVPTTRRENVAQDHATAQEVDAPPALRVTAADVPPALAALSSVSSQTRALLPSLEAPERPGVAPGVSLAPVVATALAPMSARAAVHVPSEAHSFTPSLDTSAAPAATPMPPPAVQSVPPVKAQRLPSASPPRGLLRKLVRFAGLAIAGYFALIVTLLIVYRFANPPFSSLMLQQKLTGGDVVQQWTDIDNISPQIVRAVLLSEDGRFCQHRGVDLLEMQAAIERAGDGVPRGASTISMQVIKNLFLWPSKSYVRKAIEIPLTYLMEMIWPKRRIMEVYLNIAEWGPGIFGVGAASQFHFDKLAGRLNEREAAQLAVALPNPYSRDAGDPGPQTRRLASDIQYRMRSASLGQTACVLGTTRVAR